MVVTEAKTKRPVCPLCAKPLRLCLCSRIQTPGIDNSVRVTILQHTLERKHPLNSARIATLGLKNLTVATVSDVMFDARFVICLLEPRPAMGAIRSNVESSDFDQAVENGDNQKLVFIRDGGTLDTGLFAKCPSEKNSNLVSTAGESCLRDDLSLVQSIQKTHEKRVNFVPNSGLLASDVEPEDGLAVEDCTRERGTFDLETPRETTDFFRQPIAHAVKADSFNNAVDCDKEVVATNGNEFSHLDVDLNVVVETGREAPVITTTIGKYGVINSLCHTWMPEADIQQPKFHKILASPAARDALGKGFSVKKWQKRQSSRDPELEEYEEFELEVPPGSVLLFPTDCAIGTDGLDALDFEVKNLIVLDGTWAKARRMYNENPWLQLLPHLKLDLNKMSLYGEVRSQPKAGCLSTIESIVYALKALGYKPEGLDDLLDVFKSMVEDQRRCKDERLSKVSRA